MPPAFRLGNLLSLPNAGKWRGHAFNGMVVCRECLEQPGVDLDRLLGLGAIFPATLEELHAYQHRFGESQEIITKRQRTLTDLYRSLDRRMRAARSGSAKVKLLDEFIREWSDIENQCRMRWSGEFGGLMGKTEDEVRDYYLKRESDLITLGIIEDAYRERLVVIAEPLLVAAAGFSLEIGPLHDFLNSTTFQWNSRNPKEWEALSWLPPLRYKLLHQESQGQSFITQMLTALMNGWWKLIAAILTLIATGFVVSYFRSKGINLR